MRHNPCYDCYNRRGYDFNERCENNCLYADEIARYKKVIAENALYEQKIERLMNKMKYYQDEYIKDGDKKSAAIIGSILSSMKVIFEKQKEHRPNEENEINSISGDEAFDEQIKHFMGDSYYITEPIHAHQANYVILQEIKKAYPRGHIRIIRDR